VRGERPLGFEAELAREVADGLGLRLVWADLDCAGALGAVGRGRIDAAIVPSARAAPGIPASRVALSIRVAVVLPGSPAQGADPDGDAVLEGFRPDLPVGVVRDPVALRWARRELQTLGLRLVVVPDRADAYAGALDGRFQAIVDLEHAAWAAIERLPDLHVAAGFDAGEHDVFVGAQTPLLAALDGALAELLENGRYALLFAKYFPGTPIPDETGG
jgi:ABC-type amino acid transport substrate-binding protein